MAANREVVQRRIFAKGITRNSHLFLAFYKSTTLKRKPKFSTVGSTAGQDFDANCATLRNAPRKRNCELPSISNDMQSSETLRNSLGSVTN